MLMFFQSFVTKFSVILTVFQRVRPLFQPEPRALANFNFRVGWHVPEVLEGRGA